MKGYVTNIEDDTLKNKDFREEFTAGFEEPSGQRGDWRGTHTLDQFIRVEAGSGVAVLDGAEHQISDGTAVVIPAGTKHNIINVSDRDELKLYTIYSPPEHRDGTIHKTKADALAHEEHFDGKTTE
jgi:mannose-6-phosphate isomerase-like protein (cupin superfamily)